MQIPGLDARQRRILQTVIQEFIHSAEPVASEAVLRRSGLNVSSATVRSEMAALEEQGLLEQPHTSAGRVPTDLGYRFYVDSLLNEARLAPEERQRLRRQVHSLTDEADRLVQRAARALSEEVHYPSVIATLRPQEQIFRHLHFIPLDAGRVLAVLVTNVGVFEGQPVEIGGPVDPDGLEELSRWISKLLEGLTLGEITRERLAAMVGEAAHYQRLLDYLRRWLDREIRRPAWGRVVVEGTTHLLEQPEFRHIKAISEVLSALEQDEVVHEMLRPRSPDRVWVTIGSELSVQEMRECSVVAGTYQVRGRTVGTLAIVGPKRMRYERALPLVRFLTESLSEILTHSGR
jgi:heat-inducible transcriptional repressor